MTDRVMREPIGHVESRGVRLCPIPGAMGYAAGSDGFVYSFLKQGTFGSRFSTSCRKLRGHPVGRGYLHVTLCVRPGKSQTHRVHRLVCAAFHGPCPDGMECSHLNGNPSDNRPENLAWETRSENHARKHEHGKAQVGDRHGCAKLSSRDVSEIRRRAGMGETQIGRAHV